MRKILILSIVGMFLAIALAAAAGNKKAMPQGNPAEDFYLSNYILGPGDKLEIRVYRNDDLDFTQQIDSSGMISYPLLGDLHVAGLTPNELKKKLTIGLSKFLKDPQVMVNLTAYQSNIITVIGNVNSPGVISIDHQPKLLEVISRSGGFTSDADKANVIVVRKKQTESSVMKLNLKKALEGDASQDIWLVKNDVVYVPSDMNKVVVLGEVSSPGSVELEKEINEAPMTLVEVITKAGGFASNADKSGVVLIRKSGADRVDTRKYDVRKFLENGNLDQNAPVGKGDIVFVPKLERKIVVMGEVTNPGVVEFDRNMHVVEVLSKCGGFTSNANKNSIMLIRKSKDTPQFMSLDIEKALEKGEGNQNALLEDGDMVYVPRDSKRVIVLGEVKTPGYYTFVTSLTLVDAIGKSGGLLDTADTEKIVLVRQGATQVLNVKSILRNGDIAQNIALQNGDLIYAPPSSIAQFETFLSHITKVFSSVTQIYAPVILWPQFVSGLKNESNSPTFSIPVGGSQ
ncbi:SLBB domain-containing protein [Desulfatirhabdium butyrativorans]|uniref:SLBB domain-containing protein n=1 Tax=Desulfatirhabdium butyrativorans TaxID=340467 RepID=UPI000481E9EE|nr:SLBB domain-containing protein [Desulfatirhabdium butyrativorans]